MIADMQGNDGDVVCIRRVLRHSSYPLVSGDVKLTGGYAYDVRPIAMPCSTACSSSALYCIPCGPRNSTGKERDTESGLDYSIRAEADTLEGRDRAPGSCICWSRVNCWVSNRSR